jgi:steroid delta-isomerase-like uncharacterized protein
MAADNKALTRRWFEEVWNQSREQAIDELFAPDGVAHGLGEAGQDLPGPAEFRTFYRQFRSGFPDASVRVDQVIAEGDTTAVRFTARATHSGDGLGVKATGRPIIVTGMCMIRWRDGRIAEAWNEFDVAGLLRQIGAGPGGPDGGVPRPKVKA